MSTTFLGKTIVYPVAFDVLNNETLAAAGGVEQVVVAGSESRFALSFSLPPDRGGSTLALLRAHRTRWGLATAFPFDWPQHEGVVIPSGAVTITTAQSVGKTAVTFSVAVPVGVYLTIGTTAPLYQVVAGGVGNARQLYPPLIDAVAAAAAVDLSPTINVKHRAESGISYATDSDGVYHPRVSLIESR